MKGEKTMERDLVKGFLHADGTRLANGEGQPILLIGWGLGNWLLPEGYMWNAGGSSRFDRPRRIEAAIAELTGQEYKEQFFREFRKLYITREDIKIMAELGYNSIRIPINWRLFLEEGPGIRWKEEGFHLLENCFSWCEEFRIYAFLDLHAAPGGQTGANIDDSLDDVPRLFLDEDSWNKGIALWKELAQRYAKREIVGGYDLLNEPIRPAHGTMTNYDYLLPRLIEFYEECIREIRLVDPNHLISIEGHHWATDSSVFYKKYDNNTVFHFHRYACYPEVTCLEEFLACSKRYQTPLWLGETGENLTEWYAALCPLAASFDISIHLWPWKKMNCTNSPCSIKVPKNWDQILSYLEGGPHPGFEIAKNSFDEYLENIQVEHCEMREEVTAAVFRKCGVSLMAVDFDERPGRGISYSGLRAEENRCGYRRHSGMRIIEGKAQPKRFAFDCGHDRFRLELTAGEFACYTFWPECEASLCLTYYCREEGQLKILERTEEGERELAMLPLLKGKKEFTEIPLAHTGKTVLCISVTKGLIELKRLKLQKKTLQL